MAKTNKELVVELTTAFIDSWNSKERTSPVNCEQAADIFNTFKSLIESMDDKETE